MVDVIHRKQSKTDRSTELKAELQEAVKEAESLIDVYVASGRTPVSVRIMKTFGKKHTIDVRA